MNRILGGIVAAALYAGASCPAEATQIPYESYGGLSYSQDASQVASQMRKDGFGLSQTLKKQADVYTANKQGVPVTVVCLYGPNGGLQDIVVSFKTGTGAADSVFAADTVFANEAATITREMGVLGTPASNPGTDRNGNPTGVTRKMTWPQPYNSPSKVVLDETSAGTVQSDFQGPNFQALQAAPTTAGP